jgi:hypothetical protein
MLLSFSNSCLPLFCSKELAKTDNGIYELSFGNTHKRCRLQINIFRPSAALQVASAPQFSGFKAWMGLHTAPSTSVFFSSHCFVWELLCYRQTTTKQRLAGGLHQHPLLVPGRKDYISLESSELSSAETTTRAASSKYPFGPPNEWRDPWCPTQHVHVTSPSAMHGVDSDATRFT